MIRRVLGSYIYVFHMQNVCYLFAGILNYVCRVYNVFVKKLTLYIKEKKRVVQF